MSEEHVEETVAEVVTEAPKKVMNLHEEPLFLGPKYASAGSVFGCMKQILLTHGEPRTEGGGASLMQWQFRKLAFENCRPPKKDAYTESEIQCYIRGGLKDGYFSYEDLGLNDLGSPPERAKRIKKVSEDGAASSDAGDGTVAEKVKSEKTAKITSAGQVVLDSLRSFTGPETFEAQSSVVDVAAIADDIKSNAKSVAKSVAKLVRDGFLEERKSNTNESVYLNLTQAGWAASVEAPEEAEVATGDENAEAAGE